MIWTQTRYKEDSIFLLQGLVHCLQRCLSMVCILSLLLLIYLQFSIKLHTMKLSFLRQQHTQLRNEADSLQAEEESLVSYNVLLEEGRLLGLAPTQQSQIKLLTLAA